jgi:hypothetical protein
MLDRILPISEVGREHQLSQTGHIRGKIVLRTEMERRKKTVMTMTAIVWTLILCLFSMNGES